MKLDISLIEHSYEALHKWFYRFMVRNGFSISRSTHIGQGEKIESKQLIDKYFKMLYEISYNTNIMDQ